MQSGHIEATGSRDQKGDRSRGRLSEAHGRRVFLLQNFKSPLTYAPATVPHGMQNAS